MILNYETQSNVSVASPPGGPLGVPEYNIMETKFRVRRIAPQFTSYWQQLGVSCMRTIISVTG